MNAYDENLARRQEPFRGSSEDEDFLRVDKPQPVLVRANEPASANGALFPYDRWRPQAARLEREFAAAAPYPHLVLDDFLAPAAARQMLDAFPPMGDGWIHYVHYNERTHGLNDRSRLPEIAQAILGELNSDAFVSLLADITGMASLRSDPSLEGGGLHLSERGGYLNLHSDFNVHPHRPDWRRRLNLLVFLNPEWEDSWGGHLELWDANLQRCVQRIAPRYNRAVLFRSDERSFHGYPDPIRCPPEATRKSLALYYFTAETAPLRAVSTDYHGRPGEGARRILILLDNLALRCYDRAKRTLGFDDTLLSRILRTTLRRSRRAR